MLETSLRQSLNITGGNLADMILRPICLTMHSIVGITFILPPVLKFLRKSHPLSRSAKGGNGSEK
jgi:TctA family transporter